MPAANVKPARLSVTRRPTMRHHALPAGTVVRGRRLLYGCRLGTVSADDTWGLSVIFDCGPVSCTRDEVSVLKDQTPLPEPMRTRLPYGIWTCPDGREVLFNRDYTPIWQRPSPSADALPADRDEWVPRAKQAWFYTDSTAPWIDRASLARCENVLSEWLVG